MIAPDDETLIWSPYRWDCGSQIPGNSEISELFSAFYGIRQASIFNCTGRIISSVFWRKEWFEHQTPERYGNLVLERPIVRIDRSGEFATSVVLMLDSINCFIEKRIFPYLAFIPDTTLPKYVFQKAISAPFEDTCIKLFQDYGFLTGHVTESGIWKNQKESVALQFPNMPKMPGEIDVLAYHPEKKVVFLVECKVLGDFVMSGNLRNVLGKLRDDDEEFRKKLLKKEEWLKAVFPEWILRQYSIQSGDINLYSIILTDIPFPLFPLANPNLLYHQNGILYMEYEYLKEYVLPHQI